MATTYYASRLTRAATDPQKIELIPIDFAVTTELAAGDLVHLTRIPANKRVVGGYLEIGAGGHAATGTLGDGTTADLFGSLTSMELASVQVFANTPATGLGNSATADRDLILTTADAAIHVNTTFHGYLSVEA